MEQNLYIVVFITSPSEKEAVKIASALVNAHLVACVNIVPSVRSFFFWEGKLCDEKELLLVCKTRKAKFKKLVEMVKSLHSYTVPEIIALPIVDGSSDYLEWVSETTNA